jgi:hypothetical protein
MRDDAATQDPLLTPSLPVPTPAQAAPSPLREARVPDAFVTPLGTTVLGAVTAPGAGLAADPQASAPSTHGADPRQPLPPQGTRTPASVAPTTAPSAGGDEERWFRDEDPGRHWRAPGLAWDLLREGELDGRPTTEVPAELTALGERARALLCVRLAWRCSVPHVAILPGEDAAVALVGVSADHVTPRLRATADEVLRSVAADAAAGWTAEDEVERHVPFSWG